MDYISVNYKSWVVWIQIIKHFLNLVQSYVTNSLVWEEAMEGVHYFGINGHLIV